MKEHMFRNRNKKILSAVLAVLMSVSPAMASAAEMTEQTSAGTENQDTAEETLKRKLNIDLNNGGYVIVNENTASQEKVKVEEKDGRNVFQVYDSQDVLIDSGAPACDYEVEDGSVLFIKAVSNQGYKISSTTLTGEDIGLKTPQEEFSYTVFMNEDKNLRISFSESKKKDIKNDITIENTEQPAKNKDLSIKDDDKKQTETEVSARDDLTINSQADKKEKEKSKKEEPSKQASVNTEAKPKPQATEAPKEEKKEEEKETPAAEPEVQPAAKPVAQALKSEKTAVQSDNDKDLCYVLAYEIDKIIDGTAPFDTDDAAGNDSNSENGIVRSFDTINYTLKYTTAIKNSEIRGIDSTNVMVDFLLPCSPVKAEFNVDTMIWLLDKKLTYTYEDGSTSTAYNRNKNVVSQRLTGRRLLVNSETGNTVPGTGTLAIGVNVNAAVTGDVIRPQFTICMEGNAENEKKTLTASTAVSAAPKYDIVVKRNGSANLLGYYNLEDKTAKTEAEKDSDKYGRLQTYAIALAIQNDSAQKGMKGIEYPDGSDITFDLRMSELVNGQDVSAQESYKPLLWDYAMDNGYKSTGVLGRPMSPFGQSIASVGQWTTNTPWNTGNHTGSCYHGGNMKIVPDDSDSNLLHVTLSGYQMDLKDFDFPRRWSGAPYNSIPSNTGYFSVGLLQMIARFRTSVEVIENVGVSIEASNIHARSMAGSEITSEVLTNNNLSSVQITNYPTGNHSKRNFFRTVTGGILRSTTWDAGDSYAYLGEQIRLDGHMVYTGDNYLQATNILQKFDDKAFEIPKGTKNYSSYAFSNNLSSLGTITALFAAKPDKTGWVDDNEMNNTQEEQLIYFKSIDDLTNADYKCVGMLYEVRGSKLYPNNSGGCIDVIQILNIRPDAKTGAVYMTKNNVRSWREDTDYSYANTVYDAGIKAYGIGDPNWKNGIYPNGYKAPTYRTDLNYGKAIYKDGTMVSGHTNSYQGGNSLLIIGNKTSVSIEVADRSGDKAKNVYDLDAGERTAKFTVQPATFITSENSEVQTADIKDNLQVTVTLPNGLHFNENGVSLPPESVTENQDETTTIIWKIKNVKVGAGIDHITFSTLIGEEGTANDVHHNDSFTVIAKITSDNDTRKIMAENGNYAETAISIIKLAASAVTKRVLTPLVERGQDIEFRLRYSNLSDTEAINAKVYDILPFTGDNRSTTFSGSYDLKNIRIDFSNAKRTYQNGKGKMKCYASKTERNKATMENLLTTGAGIDKFSELSGTAKDSGPEITWNNKFADAASIYMYLGYVFGHEYIDIYVTLTPKDTTTKQQPGDLYGNNFVQYADNQASIVTSNVVKAQVVKRELSGITWIDNNADGIRDAKEPPMKGVTVSLYRTSDFSKFDTKHTTDVIGNGTKVFDAYNVFGQKVADTVTGEDGTYQFDNLESGTYLITFGGIEKHYLTVTDAGTDDTIDSDATAENVDALIKEVSLPEISNMPEWTFSSPNHDIGLIRKTKVEIVKIGTVTQKLLGGADLSVYKLEDTEKGAPKKDAKPVAEWITEKGLTKVLENVLLAGRQYVLIEKKAPADYAIANPITFTVNAEEVAQRITMLDEYDTHPVPIQKKNQDGVLIGGARLKITGKEDGKAGDMEPIEWTSENGKEHVVELRKGSYALQEITPPVGYLKAEDVSFTVDKDGNIFVAGTKTDKVEMTDTEVKAGKMVLRKFDSNGKTPLANVTFSLQFVSAKYPEISENKDYYRTLKPGESMELKTNENGNLVFENLDQGEYILTETKTAAGHTLMKDSLHISLPLEMTAEEVKKQRNVDLTKAEFFNGVYHFYELRYEITNTAIFNLPKTGSNGIWKYGIFGFGALAMMGIELIFVETRKRKKSCRRRK